MVRKLGITAAAILANVFTFLVSFALAKNGTLNSSLWPLVPMVLTAGILVWASA